MAIEIHPGWIELSGAPWVEICAAPGCSDVAPYGHNVFLSRDPAETKWFCLKHDPCGGKGARGAIEPQKPEPAPTRHDDRQGSLFE